MRPTIRKAMRHILGSRLQILAPLQQRTASTGSKLVTGIATCAAAGTVLFGVSLQRSSSGQTQQIVDSEALKAVDHESSGADSKITSKEKDENDPNIALEYIKDFCNSYVGWIPGGNHFLEYAFKDIDILRQDHEEEVNNIITDTYNNLQPISKAGFSFGNVRRIAEIFISLGERLADLAGGVSPTAQSYTRPF